MTDKKIIGGEDLRALLVFKPKAIHGAFGSLYACGGTREIWSEDEQKNVVCSGCCDCREEPLDVDEKIS